MDTDRKTDRQTEEAIEQKQCNRNPHIHTDRRVRKWSELGGRQRRTSSGEEGKGRGVPLCHSSPEISGTLVE